MIEPSNNGPLAGLRVIDLTRILAGPFCTMNLGDMGAEVIKIERPALGDDTRRWGPPFIEGEAAYFLGINRNKASVTLNLKDSKGQEILKNLLINADIVIENFKVGTLDNWGITDQWREKNAPQLIHCSITGYGERGPKGGMPGYDFLLQAESGLMSITGAVPGDPTKLGVAIVDVCTGLYSAMTILAAVNARGNTGRGQRIKTSLFDTGLSILVNVASNYLISKKEAGRYGNGHPNIVPYSNYPCKSGEIALAVGNDGQFAKFSRCVGHPEWVDDLRFNSNPERVKNRVILESLIIIALSEDTGEMWIKKLTEEGVPCSMVMSVSQALESEQTKANNMVVEVEHPVAGVIKMLGIPFRFSDTAERISSPPPILGENTVEVLQKYAGLSQNDLNELKNSGVI
jgi:succinate--hydroxymethylglutarate CoA-transferase